MNRDDARPLRSVVFAPGDDADALAATMMDAWLAFARTGDPSRAGLAWPVYDKETRPTMVFGRETRVEAGPRDEERATVDALVNRPR